MSDCILFDDVKTEIKKSLGSVFGPSLDDFFVDTVEKPYRRCSSLKEFWSTYMEPTLGLFRKLKNHFPLKFNRAYTVFFSKPRERLRHGDFFLQAGFSEPGKLALKFYWEDELHASTIAECDFARLTDQEYFKKKCREAGIRANVFKKLIVIKGEEKYDRVLIENIHQLKSEIGTRDSVGSESFSDVEVEQVQRSASFPGSTSRVTVRSQISVVVASPGDKDDVFSHPPVVTQASTDGSEYSPCFGSKTAKAVNEGSVKQDTGKDLGNNPDLIAKELKEAVNVGSNTEDKQASSSEASEKKEGYPLIDASLKSASSLESSDSLRSVADSQAARNDSNVEMPLAENNDKKGGYPLLGEVLKRVKDSKSNSNDSQVEEYSCRKDFDKSAGSPDDIPSRIFPSSQTSSSEPPQVGERRSSEDN